MELRQIRNLAVVMSAGAALAIAAAGTAGAEQPSNRFGVGDAAFGPKGITTDHASLSAKGIRAVLDYPTMAEQGPASACSARTRRSPRPTRARCSGWGRTASSSNRVEPAVGAPWTPVRGAPTSVVAGAGRAEWGGRSGRG
nr:hypothetical protein GCM10020241_28420 [Streptoalloteichus tenebrarius]